MQFIKWTPSIPISFDSEYVALDCETDSKDPRVAILKTIVLADSTKAYSVDAKHISAIPFNNKIILQNFKYDFQVLRRHGIDLSDVWFRDTMLMHHLINENAEHSLDAQVQYSFGDNYKQEFWGKHETYESASEEERLEYECKDGIYTHRLFTMYSGVLRDREALVEHVHEFARHMYFTERDGVRVDVPHILDVMPKMHSEIGALEASLRPCVEEHCQTWEMQKWLTELAKRATDKGKLRVPKPEFNFSSGAQVQWLLYDALKLPVTKKTKAGKPSTDYDTLEEIEDQHEIVSRLKEYKGIQTLYNTFVVGIAERQNKGRIYPSFNINGTHTGRISSSNPNLQNMPKEGPYRGFFIPDVGNCYIGADYSQLEVVVEANLTGDKNLRRIILEGASKHDITNDELKMGDRDKAKTLNFAMGYHCGPFKVSKILGVSRSEGKYIWEKYWEVYKGCKDLKAYTDKRVDDGLPIISPFGRERHLPKTFEQEWEKAKAYRQAYNALIQGTGADITHTAFTRFAVILKQYALGTALWPVHDEILAQVRPAYESMLRDELVHIMATVGDDINFELKLSAKSYGPLTRWQKT